eukprot:Rmarinus@m.23423
MLDQDPLPWEDLIGDGSSSGGCSQAEVCGPLLSAFNQHKAGLQSVDRKKVESIVREASKNSKYYQNEQRKEEVLRNRVNDLKIRVDRMLLTEDFSKKRRRLQKIDDIVRELDFGRDLTRTFVHVDMDAFYVSVEIRDNPSLRDKPVIVGGMEMISAASYEARKFGVRSAMPGFIGLKLCPDLVMIPPDFTKYKAASMLVRQVFKEYDPNFQMMSLDEAYLDISDVVHSETGSRLGPEGIVKELRRRVRELTGLTCSAGIAPSKMLAKVCSDIHKPDGQTYLPPTRAAIASFLSNLPVRKAPGVGRVTEAELRSFGILTCGDVFRQRALVHAICLCRLSASVDIPASFRYFLSISLGIGSDFTDGEIESRKRKSISTERTFKETSDEVRLVELTTKVVDVLWRDFIDSGLSYPRTVALKLKRANFEVSSRTFSPPVPITTRNILLSHVLKILKSEISKSPGALALRLIGVRLSGFPLDLKSCNPNGQLSIVDMVNRCPTSSRSHSSSCFMEPSGLGELKGLTNSQCKHAVVSSSNSQDCHARRETPVPSASSGVITFDSLFIKEESQTPSCKDPTLTESLGPLEMPSRNSLSKGWLLLQDVRCPICGMWFGSTSNAALNGHMDECIQTTRGQCTAVGKHSDRRRTEIPMNTKSRTTNTKSRTTTSDVPLHADIRTCFFSNRGGRTQ